MIRSLILIGLFAAIGAISRYAISQLPSIQQIPMGTLIVNLLGSFLLGWLSGWSLESPILSDEWRLAIGTGFLGSFTTFSTFSLDNVRLIQQGNFRMALINITIQVLMGLALAMWGLHLSTSSRSMP